MDAALETLAIGRIIGRGAAALLAVGRTVVGSNGSSIVRVRRWSNHTGGTAGIVRGFACRVGASVIFLAEAEERMGPKLAGHVVSLRCVTDRNSHLARQAVSEVWAGVGE